ncbi:hypothetical protein [Roseobacter sp. HKCCD7870]|uniref:hypothetical protein n=1 Tax=Roseobacter sp. HKCCD7870 TaxID=3120343 RepID=UPI0030ED1AED
MAHAVRFLAIGLLAFVPQFAAGQSGAISGRVQPGIWIDPDGCMHWVADRGFDAKDLSQLQAAIYVDPDGCHIWMIGDGAEGYWSRRRDPVSGLPVCTAVAPPNSVVGDYATGGVVPVPDIRSAGLF